uniref:CIDE-N domain-containing protein n=1 Tax=Accipiter nisus TaxID=211598 RepID=A0A8B9N567_9AVES
MCGAIRAIRLEVGTTQLEVGAIGATRLDVGATWVHVGATRLEVGASSLEVGAIGATRLDVGATRLDVGGHWGHRVAGRGRGGAGGTGLMAGGRRGPPGEGHGHVPRAVARRAWSPPAPQPRPFWVCDRRRGRPRGLVAASLEELREQDGTAVETEGFFGALAPHTPLMALAPGQHWEPPKERGSRPGAEVARVTVALTKANPHDLVGQLRVTAAVRGLRCDVGGLGPERLLRELLRLLAAMTRAVGQSLLGLSAALRHLLDGASPHRVTYNR